MIDKEQLMKMRMEAENEATTVFSDYDRISRHTMPYFDIYSNKDTNTIQKQNSEIDPTIIKSSNDLVNLIMSTMLGGGEYADVEIDKDIFEKQVNFDESFRINELKAEYDSVDSQLQKAVKKTFKHINSSNAFKAITKALPECINLGTMCIKVEERPSTGKPFNWCYIPTSNFKFLPDEDDLPTNVFVEYELTWKNLKGKFNIDIPSGKSENEKQKIIECIVKVGDKFDRSVWTCDFKEQLIKPETLNYQPYVIVRFDSFSNNCWGKGIGFSLVDEFERLKHYKKLQRKSAEVNTFPPKAFWGDKGAFQRTSYRMGSINYMGASAQNAVIQDLTPSRNYVALLPEIEKSEFEIKEMYISNPLGDVAQIKGRSATEMQLRMSLFRQRFSTSYERLSEELLKPLFMNTFKILLSKKIIEFDNDYLDLINLIYTNQMSKAADREKAQELIQYVQTLMQTMPNEISLVMNWFKYATELANLMNIGKDIFNTGEEIEKNLSAMRQNLTMQQQPAQPPGTMEGEILNG